MPKINLDCSKYGQYKKDIFNKLNFNFESGKKILDIGCGDGSDAEIFIKEYGLYTYGIDIYEHKNIKKLEQDGLNFVKAGIYNIPYANNFFDYIFLHDVLHHIDEEEQNYDKHVAALREIKRVCKTGGMIIIVEANRFNLFSYPHMTLLRGHAHFRQGYFNKLINDVFLQECDVELKSFEAHFYPQSFLFLFKM